MTPWTDIPIGEKLFLNVDDTTQRVTLTGLENAFITEAGAHTRFPGLKAFCSTGTNEILYPIRWRGNLVAATSQGRLYEVDRNGTATLKPGVSIAGGKRPTNAETDDSLLIAAGGEIVTYAGKETKILSKDAPKTTHVGYLDGYVLAIETDSNRFFHSNVGNFTQWDALDVFAANANPDDLTALIVTKFREVILAGEQSIEQFEPLASGTTPFARRWTLGDGIYAPYTMVFADRAVWGVADNREFTRFSGQTAAPGSGDIQKLLHTIDNWTDAWSASFEHKGYPFVLLQVPKASNEYGGKGYTFAINLRLNQWTLLYGPIDGNGVPGLWQGRGHAEQWGRHFIGGQGKIWELDPATFQNDGQTQRLLGRTAHVGEYEVRVDNVRMKIRRGVGGASNPQIGLRCRRDNGVWTPWHFKGLGKTGDRHMILEFGGYGCGHSFQFEWVCTDNCQVELSRLQWQTMAIGE